MNAQYIYNEKRLDSLKAASQPIADEVRRMKELDGIISSEQVELAFLLPDHISLSFALTFFSVIIR
jgi:hypothetical protein